MKKIIIIILIFTLSTICLADDKQVVDFQKALEMAFQNNVDLKITQLNLANSQIAWEKNKLSADADTRSQQLKLTLDLAKNQQNYRQARFDTIYSILNDFISFTSLLKTVEVNELQLKIKELELERINELYGKGISTSLELMNARVALEEQRLNLHIKREDLTEIIDNLKFKTGVQDEVMFIEFTPSVLPLEIGLEEALEKATNTSFEIKEKEINYQLACLELEKAELENKPELEIKELINNKEIASLSLVKAKNDLKEIIKDQFRALDQALKTIEVKENELAIAKESYEQTKRGYEKGFYTESQFLQSKASLLNSENAVFNAKADYFLKTIQFYQMLGEDELIGVTPIEEVSFN